MQIVDVPEKLGRALDNSPISFHCEQNISSSVSDLSLLSRADGNANNLRGAVSRGLSQMSHLVSNT
jgi:hypothetical protein